MIDTNINNNYANLDSNTKINKNLSLIIKCVCAILLYISCIYIISNIIITYILIHDKSGPYYGVTQMKGYVISPPLIPSYSMMIYAEFDSKKLSYAEKEIFIDIAKNFGIILCNDKRINVSINSNNISEFHFSANVSDVYEKMIQHIRKGMTSDAIYPYLYSSSDVDPNLKYIDAIMLQTSASTIMGDSYYIDDIWC